MAKHKNLQPWLDYFEMLHTYEQKGFLQIEAEKHEAYVTHPAFLTLCGFDMEPDGMEMPRTAIAMGKTIRRLRTYAAFISQDGADYDRYAFAVHVVKDVEPHDLLHTIVLTTRRRWWKLWMRHDSFDVISY